jgi:DNA-binding transcriptional ArsR family regulator
MLLLKTKDCDVTTISKSLKIEQSLVSHNMKKLLSCNLVHSKRQGKTKIYSLNKKVTLPILKIYEKNILKNCCSICKQKK